MKSRVEKGILKQLNFKDIILGNLHIDKSVNKLENNACSYFNDLIKVTMSNSVEIIGGSAFASCKKLKSVELPKSIKEIGYAAFASCETLEKISIPKGVKVKPYAFQYCIGLKKAKIDDNLFMKD